MGLGLDTTLIFGVVGIGYMINEASVQTSKIQYDNLPVALAKSNVTNSIAYSLWLNDLSKSSRDNSPHSATYNPGVQNGGTVGGEGLDKELKLTDTFFQAPRWEASCSGASTCRSMLAT